MAYVLILILTSDHGVALERLEGFKDVESCEVSGKAWVATEKHDKWALAVKDYACVLRPWSN